MEKTQKSKKKKTKVELDFTQEMVFTAARAAEDKKAEDILIIDVSKLTSIADFFLIVTANNVAQIRAVSNHVIECLKDAGYKKISAEGMETNGWHVIDYGDIVVHIMTEEQRVFYKLESFWSNGKVIDEDTWKNAS